MLLSCPFRIEIDMFVGPPSQLNTLREIKIDQDVFRPLAHGIHPIDFGTKIKVLLPLCWPKTDPAGIGTQRGLLEAIRMLERHRACTFHDFTHISTHHSTVKFNNSNHPIGEVCQRCWSLREPNLTRCIKIEFRFTNNIAVERYILKPPPMVRQTLVSQTGIPFLSILDS